MSGYTEPAPDSYPSAQFIGGGVQIDVFASEQDEDFRHVARFDLARILDQLSDRDEAQKPGQHADFVTDLRTALRSLAGAGA